MLAQRYTDADFARLAHDDSGVLSQIESGIAATTRWAMGANYGRTSLFGQARGAVNDMSKGAAGQFRALFEVTAPALDFLESERSPIGGNPLRRLAEGFDTMARTPVFEEEKITQPLGLIESGVASGIRSFGANAAMLPMAMLPGGQAAALTMLAGCHGGTAYAQERGK